MLKNNGNFECAIFVHGLFFAHEDEEESIMTGTTGSFHDGPEYPDLTKKKTQWERYPLK